jgi:death-on-curing protein
MAPLFIDPRLIDAQHFEALRRWGGSPGMRDEGALEAALARPVNKLAYGDVAPDLFALAAAYAYGLSTLHPYVDGNKRTALAASALFLALNGWRLDAPGLDAFRAMVELVTGKITEDDFAALLRGWSKPRT